MYKLNSNCRYVRSCRELITLKYRDVESGWTPTCKNFVLFLGLTQRFNVESQKVHRECRLFFTTRRQLSLSRIINLFLSADNLEEKHQQRLVNPIQYTAAWILFTRQRSSLTASDAAAHARGIKLSDYRRARASSLPRRHVASRRVACDGCSTEK